MSVVGCELTIRNGRKCGITAVGRCYVDGQAFCDSHRARSFNTQYVDLCTVCFTAQLSTEKSLSLQANATRKSEQGRIAECIRTLDSRGGVGLRERSITKKEYKSFLGITRTVEKVVPLEPAWPVGDLKWTSPERRNMGEITCSVPSGITRSLTLVPLGTSPYEDRKLEAWNPYSEGPLGNESVRHQVFDALERLVAGLATTG